MTRQIPVGWSVEAIEVFGHEFAKLHLVAADGRRANLNTPDFGVGRRGPKTVALARFAEFCGFGSRREIYEFIWALPEDWAGPLFPAPRFGLQPDPEMEAL